MPFRPVIDIILSNKLQLFGCLYAACLTINSSRLFYMAQWKANEKEEDHKEME